MAQKVKCNRTTCKHHTGNNKCDTRITIDANGGCASFEKGFIYYIRLVWDALGGGNFIDAYQVTPDLRIGLYYVMELYHLGFSTCEHGSWRIISLHDNEDGPALSAKEITDREIDMTRLHELLEDFNAGELPGPSSEFEPEKGEKADCDFGWLAPDGEFTESPWGEHEESAEAICAKRGLEADYEAWRYTDNDMILYRDYLISARGYCLIHNPSLDGGYIVTHRKPLTKKQCDFLYAYFTDKGDRFKAEMYLQER